MIQRSILNGVGLVGDDGRGFPNQRRQQEKPENHGNKHHHKNGDDQRGNRRHAALEAEFFQRLLIEFGVQAHVSYRGFDCDRPSLERHSTFETAMGDKS